MHHLESLAADAEGLMNLGIMEVTCLLSSVPVIEVAKTSTQLSHAWTLGPAGGFLSARLVSGSVLQPATSNAAYACVQPHHSHTRGTNSFVNSCQAHGIRPTDGQLNIAFQPCFHPQIS